MFSSPSSEAVEAPINALVPEIATLTPNRYLSELLSFGARVTVLVIFAVETVLGALVGGDVGALVVGDDVGAFVEGGPGVTVGGDVGDLVGDDVGALVVGGPGVTLGDAVGGDVGFDGRREPMATVCDDDAEISKLNLSLPEKLTLFGVFI